VSDAGATPHRVGSQATRRVTLRCVALEVILFDVFGTLVEYERQIARLSYPSTHALVASWGVPGDHDDFVRTWTDASTVLEDVAAVDHREYGMTEVAARFAGGCQPALSAEQQVALVASFMAEWKLGIRPIDGVAAMIRRLAGSFRLGVVSNTHDPAMVPELLDRLEVRDAFEVVVLSVDHGHRKPHPSIYRAAASAFDCPPARTAFVGDTLDADFHGPTRAGMQAWLIDPRCIADVDPSRRLHHILDLEHHLAEASAPPRRAGRRRQRLGLNATAER
jgi:putative hydrolase of the HAD superfamily